MIRTCCAMPRAKHRSGGSTRSRRRESCWYVTTLSPYQDGNRGSCPDAKGWRRDKTAGLRRYRFMTGQARGSADASGRTRAGELSRPRIRNLRPRRCPILGSYARVENRVRAQSRGGRPADVRGRYAPAEFYCSFVWISENINFVSPDGRPGPRILFEFNTDIGIFRLVDVAKTQPDSKVIPFGEGVEHGLLLLVSGTPMGRFIQKNIMQNRMIDLLHVIAACEKSAVRIDCFRQRAFRHQRYLAVQFARRRFALGGCCRRWFRGHDTFPR